MLASPEDGTSWCPYCRDMVCGLDPNDSSNHDIALDILLANYAKTECIVA